MASNISINTSNLGVAWQSNEVYRVVIDDGFVNQDGGLRLPVTGGQLTTFTTNSFPPKIGNTTPTHTSTAPGGFEVVSFGIDRSNLTILGGNVSLYQQATPNVLVKTITVSNVAGQGNVVAMNIVGNILPNQTYFVTLTANTFQDRDGFRNNAVTNSSSFRFISPIPPFVASTVPSNNNQMVGGTTEVSMIFDRTISSNIGNLYLFNANTNALIKSIPIGSANIANNTVSMSLVGNIEANTRYYIRANSNIVIDNTRISSNISAGNIFTFVGPTNPYITSTYPTASSLLANTTVISFTFDRLVNPNTGNIYLYSNTNQLIKKYDILSNITQSTSSNIDIDTASVIDILTANTSYYITSNVDIVKDAVGIKSNISGNILTFTTIPVPQLVTTYPTTGNVNNMENENISLFIDQTVNVSNGNLYLKKLSDDTVVKTYNPSNVVSGGQTVTLDIKGLLDPSIGYYITTEANTIQNSLFGFKMAPITSNTTFTFTNKQSFSRDYPNTFALGSSNLITNANYSGNVYNLSYRTLNSIANVASSATNGSFSSEGNISYPEGYSGGNGYWQGGYPFCGGGGGAGGPGANATFGGSAAGGIGKFSSITGTPIYYSRGGGGPGYNGVPPTTAIVSPANSGYGGDSGYGGGSGIVVVRYISGYSNVSATGGNVTTYNGYTIHTFTSNSTFTITSNTSTIIEYLIVGGGGAAGGSGGGGGAGGFKESAIEISSGSYPIIVGAGGSGSTFPYGNNGGDSSAFGIVAHGGGGGCQLGWAAAGQPGGSGGGGGADYNSRTGAGGATLGDIYTKSLGFGQITGNLQQVNSYLNNISITTVNNVVSPYNIYYRLINGNGEMMFRTYTNTGILSYASPVLSILPPPTITGVTLLSGNTSANVSYTGGGNAVIYTAVGISNTSVQGTSIEIPNGNITVSGLRSGTTYSFVVYSTDAQGQNSSNSLPFSYTMTGGSNAAYFPANLAGSYLSTQPSANGTSNWTYEAWVYNFDTNSNNVRPIFDTRAGGGSSTGWMLRQNAQGWLWLRSGSGADVGFSIATGRNNNSWQHIALVRISNNIYFYVDGVLKATGSTTINYSDNALRIGAFIDDSSISAQYQGYMDNIRVSNIARYTTTFTPSTVTSDGNTKLLLDFNGNFNDSSPANRTVTAYGNVSIVTI